MEKLPCLVAEKAILSKKNLSFTPFFSFPSPLRNEERRKHMSRSWLSSRGSHMVFPSQTASIPKILKPKLQHCLLSTPDPPKIKILFSSKDKRRKKRKKSPEKIKDSPSSDSAELILRQMKKARRTSPNRKAMNAQPSRHIKVPFIYEINPNEVVLKNTQKKSSSYEWSGVVVSQVRTVILVTKEETMV